SPDDLAAVLAAVLTQPGDENATYDVTGPEALSLAETADRLSALVGRPLAYQPETREQALPGGAAWGRPTGRWTPGSAPTRPARRGSSPPSATPSRGSPARRPSPWNSSSPASRRPWAG